MDTFDLNQPDLYIGRELSLVEFNHRVLAQASDPQVPLLERLRYMCISSTNLDEMFEVRIAGLKQKAELGSVQRGPDNLAPQETLRLLSESCHVLVDEQYRVLNEELLPALAKEGIRFIRRTKWTEGQAEYGVIASATLHEIRTVTIVPDHQVVASFAQLDVIAFAADQDIVVAATA